MSAWIVSKAHIDCLVQSMAMEGIITFAEADATGKTLWSENHKSINFRYSENTRRPAYKFEGVEAPLDPAIVAKQVACYDYQTCEHPSYEKSKAFRLTTRLFDALLVKLGMDKEAFYASNAWKSGPWGIDSIEQAIPADARFVRAVAAWVPPEQREGV